MRRIGDYTAMILVQAERAMRCARPRCYVRLRAGRVSLSMGRR